jgi:hypothetical protein
MWYICASAGALLTHGDLRKLIGQPRVRPTSGCGLYCKNTHGEMVNMEHGAIFFCSSSMFYY